MKELKNVFSERLKYAMELRGMKSAELSRRTKIDKGQISSYRSGRYAAGPENLYELAFALRVSPAWLMGCENVPMEVNDWTDSQIEESVNYLNGVLKDPDDIEMRLITKFKTADEKTQKAILTLLDIDLNEQEEIDDEE